MATARLDRDDILRLATIGVTGLTAATCLLLPGFGSQALPTFVVLVLVAWFGPRSSLGETEAGWQLHWGLIGGASGVLLLVTWFVLGAGVAPARPLGVLAVFMSLLLFGLQYRSGLIAWLILGTGVVWLSFTLPPFFNVTATILLFVGVYVSTALARVETDGTEDSERLRDVLVYGSFYGLGLIVPVVIVVVSLQALLFGADSGTLGLELLSEYEGEPSGNPGQSLRDLAFHLLVLTFWVLGVLGLLWYFSGDPDEEEVVDELPQEANLDVRGTDEPGDETGLRPVVMGGPAGDVVNLVHEFLRDQQGTDRERRDDEPVAAYFDRLLDELSLEVSLVNPIRSAYDRARYGPADEIDKELVRVVREGLKELRREVSDH